MKGLELLESIKRGEIEEDTRIKVYETIFDFDYDYITDIYYRNNNIEWEPGTFKVNMLYNDDYAFMLTETKADEIHLQRHNGEHLSLNMQDENLDKIEKTLNKIIKIINENK